GGDIVLCRAAFVDEALQGRLDAGAFVLNHALNFVGDKLVQSLLQVYIFVHNRVVLIINYERWRTGISIPQAGKGSCSDGARLWGIKIPQRSEDDFFPQTCKAPALHRR
ncbi:MAG: hypothetical protein LBQ68_00865, partial [Clostridiales bacterium]|nr:hypothetical protein [Clostridiales bacterium]